MYHCRLFVYPFFPTCLQQFRSDVGASADRKEQQRDRDRERKFEFEFDIWDVNSDVHIQLFARRYLLHRVESQCHAFMHHLSTVVVFLSVTLSSIIL